MIAVRHGELDGADAPERPPRPRAAWRSVAVPSEHGGWGLTLEPVVLGLLARPGLPGFALGAAAFVAFLARTPLKVVLVDRRRGRWLPRSRLALEVLVVELVVLLGLVAAAASSGDSRFWVPVGLAAPLVAVELWFDMRSRSRRLVPEMAGTVGIGAAAAAIVLLDGGAVAVAAGAWVVVALRAVASLPYVRAQLARARHGEIGTLGSELLQVAVVAAATTAGAAGLVPWAAVAVLALLAGFQVLTLHRRPPRAAVVGAQQLVLGLTLAVVAGLTLS